MLTARPLLPASTNRIGLPAQEGRNLQNVANFGRRGDLTRLVDVGENRQAGLALDRAQDAQAFIEARPAVGIDAGAIRLVERRLEDGGHPGPRGGFGDHPRDRDGVILGLNHARAADQREGCLIADHKGIDAGKPWGIGRPRVHYLLIIRTHRGGSGTPPVPARGPRLGPSLTIWALYPVREIPGRVISPCGRARTALLRPAARPLLGGRGN